MKPGCLLFWALSMTKQFGAAISSMRRRRQNVYSAATLQFQRFIKYRLLKAQSERITPLRGWKNCFSMNMPPRPMFHAKHIVSIVITTYLLLLSIITYSCYRHHPYTGSATPGEYYTKLRTSDSTWSRPASPGWLYRCNASFPMTFS